MFKLAMLKESIKGQLERNNAVRINFLEQLKGECMDMPLADVLELVEQMCILMPGFEIEPSTADIWALERETVTLHKFMVLARDFDMGQDPNITEQNAMWEFPMVVMAVRKAVKSGSLQVRL